MTVATTTSRVEYSGNAVTLAFSVPFYFLANADLKVYVAGVLQTLTTHYSVSGAGNPAGGTVTFVSAPASGAAVVIFRDPAALQETDYPPNDPFPSESHERALDKLTMIAQRLGDLAGRSLSLADGLAGSINTVLPTPEANKFLAWNVTANALQNVDNTTLVTLVNTAGAQADVFSGNGVQTVFTLTSNPGNVANLDISISGVTQRPGIDFTWISGTTLTFLTAPPSGTQNVLVRYIVSAPIGNLENTVIGAVTPAAGTFTTLSVTGATTLTGAATLTANPTLSGGTANGVLYLDGSKVATSGSALTFDGTEFKVNAASGNVLVQPSNAANAKLYMRHGSIANNNGFEVDVSSNTIFLQAGSEAMRLTSTGLGIGTASPGNRLHVHGSGDISRFTNGTVSLYGYSDSQGLGWFTGTVATGTGVYYNNTSSYQAMYTGGVERMRLDASGNLGLGTASPVNSGNYATLTINGTTGGQLAFMTGGTALQYVYTTASEFVMRNDGTTPSFKWLYAGTTQMTLDASGNLGLNTATFGTSAAGVLALGTGTAPTTGPADTVQLFSVDRSAGNTIPAIRCEGSGVTNAGITNTTVTNKIAVQVNGTIYYLLATTNAT